MPNSTSYPDKQRDGSFRQCGNASTYHTTTKTMAATTKNVDGKPAQCSTGGETHRKNLAVRSDRSKKPGHNVTLAKQKNTNQRQLGRRFLAVAFHRTKQKVQALAGKGVLITRISASVWCGVPRDEWACVRGLAYARDDYRRVAPLLSLLPSYSHSLPGPFSTKSCQQARPTQEILCLHVAGHWHLTRPRAPTKRSRDGTARPVTASLRKTRASVEGGVRQGGLPVIDPLPSVDHGATDPEVDESEPLATAKLTAALRAARSRNGPARASPENGDRPRTEPRQAAGCKTSHLMAASRPVRCKSGSPITAQGSCSTE